MKKFLSLFYTFALYQLLSIILSLIGISFLHFVILKNSFPLLCVTLVILMLIHIFTINKILNSKYIKNKFSIIILSISNIFYYIVFFINWLNKPLNTSGKDDLGIGLLIVFFNLSYLGIIISSIIFLIDEIIDKKHINSN